MAAGDEVTKYGEIIGKASCDVSVGQWVHTHNVESARARGDLSASP
jgi:altronate dehydratase small subunit